MSSSLSSSPGAASARSSGTGSTSGSSSRARSLSGACPGVDYATGDVVMMNGHVRGGGGKRRRGLHLFRSTSDDWETTPSLTTTTASSWSESGPPSPDSCGELDGCQMNDEEGEDEDEEEDGDDFFKSVRNHRRVESERCGFFFSFDRGSDIG